MTLSPDSLISTAEEEASTYEYAFVHSNAEYQLCYVFQAKPLSDYRLKVGFDNGEERIFDVKPYIKGEWFSELLDMEVFNAVKVEGLSVAWPDGQDIAPECLYLNAIHA